MSGKSKIEWTGATWNPIRARLKKHENLRINTGKRALRPGTWGYHCERVSPGCQHCYACAMNGRTLPAWGTGLDYTRQSRDKVEIYLDEEELLKPLHWKKARYVFPSSMTDLFAEFVPDEFIDRMFAVMALCPQHTFQVLTKRAERMAEYFSDGIGFRRRVVGTNCSGCWGPEPAEDRICAIECECECHEEYEPLANVWFGVSVEDQQRADERIPHLLRTPAALRWVSYEPALGPVDFGFGRWVNLAHSVCSDLPSLFFPIRRVKAGIYRAESNPHGALSVRTNAGDLLGIRPSEFERLPNLDWVVCGGESGPGARTCDLDWLRSVRDQCAAAGVPCFVKQLGARPIDSSYAAGVFAPEDSRSIAAANSLGPHDHIGFNLLLLRDRKGGEPSEWPEDLRVRQMPEAAGARAC